MQFGDSRTRLTYASQRFLETVTLCEDDLNERIIKCVLGRTVIVDKEVLGSFDNLTDLPENAQIRKIIDYMEYLNTGFLEKNESVGDFNSSIYPVTGKYRSSSESSDQCRVANFSIRIDVNGNGMIDYMKNVNILTEFS